MSAKRHREVIRIATSEGVIDAAVSTRTKHPRLTGIINGKPLELVFSATPSDPCSHVRIRNQLRRLARGEAAWS